MAQSDSLIFRSLCRICVLGRVTLYSLGIAQWNEPSNHWQAGLTYFGDQRAFPLSNFHSGMKLVMEFMVKVMKINLEVSNLGPLKNF